MSFKEGIVKQVALFLGFVFLACPLLCRAQQTDWLTWGYDPERTAWNRAETKLSKDNVSGLQLKWAAQLDTAPEMEVLSTLTSPLVVEGVQTPGGLKDLVVVVGSRDKIYALDAATGSVVWQKEFTAAAPPKQGSSYLCPNTVNATPVIDKSSGIVYLTTSDGKLRGLSIRDGEDRFPPTDFVTPYARNWSLNLIDGVIYTPVARGCGGAAANFAAMDVKDPSHPKTEFNTSAGRPAGAWGRGGLVRGPLGLYGQTADGPYDPERGRFGQSIVAVRFRNLELVDHFTPENWQDLNTRDIDLGSAGPVIFPFRQWTLLAAAGKEAVLYLLDAKALSGAGRHTPLHSERWGNDENRLWGRGVWGAMATWEDDRGERWLFMPMWGPPAKDTVSRFQYTYGPAERGSIMAFRLAVENDKPVAVPVWTSVDMHVPDPPVIANGVVYAVATGENTRQGGYFPPEVRARPRGNAVLYAFDAATGKVLYSSEDLVKSWAHFGGPAVSKGRVYFTTWDAKVYSFGIAQ
jgi:outer membrane protein assembly factor BamB